MAGQCCIWFFQAHYSTGGTVIGFSQCMAELKRGQMLIENGLPRLKEAREWKAMLVATTHQVAPYGLIHPESNEMAMEDGVRSTGLISNHAYTILQVRSRPSIAADMQLFKNGTMVAASGPQPNAQLAQH